MLAPLRFLRAVGRAAWVLVRSAGVLVRAARNLVRAAGSGGARFLRARPARPDRREDADARGRRGERAAVRHLRRAGYRVLARRLRTRGGEVDVLALDGPTLVLVEVKATLGSADAARARVDPRKRDRQRGAHRALARHPRFARRPYRFDVVTVVLRGRRAECTLHRGFAPLSR